MNIDVCFTPNDYQAQSLPAHVAVVIDVLRATTSLTVALENGCKRIVPVETVEQALAQKERSYPEALLAGERQALPIPGFDLGNSPFEYSRQVVLGKTIIMTTTNGTVALHRASGAEKVYAAAFVNNAAICNALRQIGHDIVVLCAGTAGQFSLEDGLCAGLIADRLSDCCSLSDRALATQAMYRDFRLDIKGRILIAAHAHYLEKIGFGKDVTFCMQHDLFALVPVFADGIISLQSAGR